MNAPLYLIAGGRNSKDGDFLLRSVLASTGIVAPTVAYIGTASGDNTLFFGMMKSALAKAGFGKVELARLCSKKADVDRFRQTIEKSDTVFVSGGDVKEGMDVLHEKGMVDFLRACYAQGKPFFGISAGSIMMGSHWVFWEDESDDNSACLFPCLGFVPFICDTHDDTGAWDELKTALKLSETSRTGFGLPSGSSLCCKEAGKVAALGCAVNRFTGHKGVVKQEKDLVPLI